MSATESLISDIEREYWRIRKTIEGCLGQCEKSGLSEREAVALFDQLVRFQNFLESKELQGKQFSGVVYYKRFADRFSKILDLVRSEQALRTQLGGDSYYSSSKTDGFQYDNKDHRRWADDMEGLVAEAEDLILRSESGTISAQTRSLSGMHSLLKDMELLLIKLYGDLRLMSGVTYFTVEQRTRVIDTLLKSGFKESVSFLDDADSNLRLEKPHLKDSLHNLRLAIESVVYDLSKQEKVTVVNRFSVDLNELSQMRPLLIDVPTRVMIQGVTNYLSVTGSHVFGKIDTDSIGLVELGFGQAYTVLDQLLTRIHSSKSLTQKAPV